MVSPSSVRGSPGIRTGTSSTRKSTRPRVTPYADADLPGTPIPVEHARVSFVKPASVQNTTDVTASEEQGVPQGALGRYSMLVVPDPLYRVAFVPADPLIPFRSMTLGVTEDSVFDVDLGYGVAVYGQVLAGRSDPQTGHVLSLSEDPLR